MTTGGQLSISQGLCPKIL